MNDVEALRPGDVLIGFSKHGPATVVSNKQGFGGARVLSVQIGENMRLMVNVTELAEHVRVLKSRW